MLKFCNNKRAVRKTLCFVNTVSILLPLDSYWCRTQNDLLQDECDMLNEFL